MNIFKEKNWALCFVFFLIAIGILARLIPHVPNFVPIGAIALFGAVYLPKKIGLVLPLVAIFISDLFLGFYDWPVMAAVYSSFVLMGVLGWVIKKKNNWTNIMGASILGAIIFFIVTNFVVWAFTPWYTKSIVGLIQCFIMALPFFRSTLVSNIFYSFCFFGAYKLSVAFLKQKFTNFCVNNQ